MIRTILAEGTVSKWIESVRETPVGAVLLERIDWKSPAANIGSSLGSIGTAILGGLRVFGVMGFIVGPAIASFFPAIVDIYKKEFTQTLAKE